jgi:membrane protease YdiL (CAAX protease family)
MAFLLPTLILLLNSLVSLAIGPSSPSISLTIARILILLILILGLVYGAVQLEETLTERWEWFALKEKISLPWAVVISSLVFSAAHYGNPGFNVLAVIGLILSGAFLAYSYIATRSLWLPIGIHVGWNFFEGCVFGFPVSGTNAPRLILHSSEGPALWTGGIFGPEAGLVLLPGLALGVFLIWAFASSQESNEGETTLEE